MMNLRLVRTLGVGAPRLSLPLPRPALTARLRSAQVAVRKEAQLA